MLTASQKIHRQGVQILRNEVYYVYVAMTKPRHNATYVSLAEPSAEHGDKHTSRRSTTDHPRKIWPNIMHE